MMTLKGCVQGFAQGGYFLSDAVDKKGKTKHYLLVNDNDELKQHEGRMVEVSGTPSPFGWSVKIKAQDMVTEATIQMTVQLGPDRAM